MPLQEIWNRILRFSERKRTMFRRAMVRRAWVRGKSDDQGPVRLRSLFRALDRCHQIFNKGAGKCHFECSSFFFSGRGLVLFFLGRSGKTPPQSCGLLVQDAGRDFPYLYPARLTITAPGARQFLRTNSNLGQPNFVSLKFFRRRASWRCATAGCDRSLLRWPSPASWSAAGTSPASHRREAHP